MSGHCQVYQFSTPVSGNKPLSVHDADGPAGSEGTVVLVFSNLSETVYLDAVAQTIRQVGTVSYFPSIPYITFQETQSVSVFPNPPVNVKGTVTVQLALNGGVLSFDTGPQPVTWNAASQTYTFNGNIGDLPAYGSWSLITGGATNAGSFTYSMYPDLGGAFTFSSVSLVNYPASLQLSGLGTGGGFFAYQDFDIVGETQFAAPNGFNMQLVPGIANCNGNNGSCDGFTWSANPVTATNLPTSQTNFLTNGLVAYYPFNGNANDASGNGNNGTNNGVQFGTDRLGQPNSAGIFNGSSWIEVPYDTNIDLQTFSMSLWLRFNDLPTLLSEYEVALAEGQGDARHGLYFTTFNYFSEIGGPPMFGYQDLDGSGYYSAQIGQPIANWVTNQWCQLVIIRTTTNAQLYIDGQLTSADNNITPISPSTTGPLIIGAGYSGGSYSAGFRGGIDDIRIYNRALSSNEVAQLYAYESNPTGGIPIAITSQPQSIVVNAHSSTSFSVGATGPSPLSYQWSFNSTNISGATNATLTISNVGQTNLGVYAVVVSDAGGSITSSNATLAMYPYLSTPFTGDVSDWGQSATFGVQAWGTGPLSFQWFDNGVAILNATNQTLALSSIQFTNAGLYSVVVSSPFGSVTNTPARVVVNVAGVSLGFSPTLTITGIPGFTYVIQSTTNLENPNAWVTLTNMTLVQPVQLFIDTTVDASSPFNSQHFYEVLPGQ